MRLAGIIAMLRKNTATWPPARSPRAGSTTGRSRGSRPGMPGWPGTVRPVNAVGTNGA
jgi:hypothetical protein